MEVVILGFKNILRMMNRITKPYFLLSVLVMALVCSCRTENDLSIDPLENEYIQPNPTLANLMGRVAMSDGSVDNIIDQSSSLRIQLPVTVTANGTELFIEDEDGYQDIENIFDLSDDDEDILIISYPITVIAPDFTTYSVNSDSELENVANIFPTTEDDDDIECIDFEYPITLYYFNELTETMDSVTINEDSELFNFIIDLQDYTAVTIGFPVVMIFSEGTTETIETAEDLENIILVSDNTCDEDDDNDYGDDDCESCSTTELEDALAQCTEWSIDKLFRDNNNLVSLYTDYTFTFNGDGTITVIEGANIFEGTWEAVIIDDELFFDVNVTDLPDFNDTWEVININMQPTEKKIELRLGVDRLRFGSYCN